MEEKEQKDTTDNNIKKMSVFLKQGATMLDLSCPVCNNPLFQLKNGDKACVICERKVIYENERDDLDNGINERDHHPKNPVNLERHKKIKPPQILSTNQIREKLDGTSDIQEFKRICIDKLRMLFRNLDGTEYRNEIKEIGEVIDILLDILLKFPQT
ncbi:MAG: Sjogren's syndrome/scleroderma autoantigen 1 family protein [Promethearchaeota archaeon]